MATARDIVNRAFRKIDVAGVGEALDAEQSDEGLETLNMMLHEWKLRGVDLTHTDLAFGDTFPLASEYEMGTVYMLSAHLSPNYQAPSAFNADDFFRAIQAAYATIATVTLDSALTDLPSRRARDGTLGWWW
jgi:hypothetical protein